jgi:predicted MPP superfamily phosphohydrolase
MLSARAQDARWTSTTFRGAAVAIGAAALAVAEAGRRARHVAPYRPVLERVDIRVPTGVETPPRLRIGFLADTHVGSVIRAADIDRALALLLAAGPDLLLFGGDYVSESPRHISDAAAVLGNVANTTRFGSLAVLGNHDYANGAERMAAALEQRGVRVLRNESVRAGDDTGELWIAGIDDALLGSPDPQRAFASVPASAGAIALWHESGWAEQVVQCGAFLQLSGHSHGGQVQLPVAGPIATPAGGRRFVEGLNFVAGMPVYTTRGVGVYRPPLRFRCPPEVTSVTLI